MAKKNSGRPATKYVTRCFTTKKTRRCSYTVALPSVQQQAPVKIEGVRLRKSRWIAEIKHPNKKYVRIWLGSYATPEEASQVYQSKKMEHEKIKLQATARKDKKLVGDQEVGYDAESSPDDRDVAMKGIDLGDQAMEEVVFDDQAIKADDLNDQETVNVLEESKAESLFDDRDVDAESSPDDRVVAMKGIDLDDQAMEEVVFDDQAIKADDFNDQETVNVLEESKSESLFDNRNVAVNAVEFDDQVMKVVDYQAEKSLSRGKVVEQEIGDMLLQLGPVLIDRYGHILGEFSWMDDLSITS